MKMQKRTALFVVLAALAPAAVRAAETPEGLQQLVAPIALYPDALVAQIFAASTYPTQIVDADRWMQQNPGLQPEELAARVDQQEWYPSVKALTQFPTVLAELHQDLSWTSALGDAYTNQQQAVLDAVQTMRQRALSAGTLTTTPQQTVTTQGQTIVVQPATPDIVYVPTYDPWVVYGSPIAVYPGWVPWGGVYTGGPLVTFGVGFGIGWYAGFGWGWHHWDADWRHHSILHDHDRFISHSRTFIDHGHFYGGRPEFHAAPVPHGFHPAPFSGFNHGGVTDQHSFRGRSSFGGGFHGGGFHAGGMHR